MLASGQLYICLPIMHEIANYYSISSTLVPIVGTSFGLSYAIGFLIWGPISDHYGRYLTLLIGLSLTCLTTIGTAIAENFSLEIVFRILQGLSAASIAPIGLALLSEILPEKSRSIGLALMSFSFIVAAPIAQFYAKVTGLNFPALMFFGACSFAFCLVTLIFIRSRNFGKHIRRSYSLKNNFKSLICNPKILTAWGISITVLFSFVVFQTLLHSPLNVGNLNSTEITIYTIAGMTASFIAGPIIQKFGGIRIACLGLLFSVLSLFLAYIMHSFGGFSIVMLSIGTALTLPSIISIVSSQASNLSRGMAISIYSFIVFFGASLGPLYVQLVNLSGFNLLLPPCFLLTLSIGLLNMINLRIKFS